MSDALAVFSASISRLVAAVAPLLAAIRIGPNRHVTGLLCSGDKIVTTDQALPLLDSYTVVLPNRSLVAASPGPRDTGGNLAVLLLAAPAPAAQLTMAEPTVGSLALVLGAEANASPTARLRVIHRLIRTGEGLVPVLDLPGERVDPGSLVLDPAGGLIGLATPGPDNAALVIPAAAIARRLAPNLPPATAPAAPQPAPQPAPLANRRGWLGVALQPITVPEALAARVGQSSGRMVVSLTKGGPAEQAGMKVGDVLLALDGTSTNGAQSLRSLLGGDLVGATVEVRLLRDGSVLTRQLTVAAQPD
jgi:S1-C subfamily serine protease